VISQRARAVNALLRIASAIDVYYADKNKLRMS